LTLDRIISIPAEKAVSCWVLFKRTAGDSIWFGEDGRNSFLVRTGSTIYSRTTTTLQTLSVANSTGWLSWTMYRDSVNSVLYTENTAVHGIESSHTGIFNIQHLNNMAADDMAVDGSIAAMAVWGRTIKPGMRADLYSDPFLMTRRAFDWPVSATGGGGATSPSPRTNIQGPLMGSLGGPIA
jgi:hypothetical protein